MKIYISIMLGFVYVSQAAVFQWTVNGHYYEPVIVDEGITWTEAKLAAEQAGGYLATPTSVEENSFVFSLIDESKYWSGNNGPWLGGYQPEGATEPNEGWSWVTGEPNDFVAWASGQPNEYQNLNQDALRYYPAIQSTWDDSNHNNQNLSYVIEYDTFQPNPTEWPVSEGGNGHAYQVVVVDGGISWTDAKTAAEEAGGYLATVTSADEEIWIQHLINDSVYWVEYGTGSLYGPWLGGFQVPDSGEPVGEWRWITGEAFKYTNWIPKEPNNFPNQGCLNQDRLHYYRGDPSQTPIAAWNDTQGDCPPWHSWSYIIEYSSSICTEEIESDINHDCYVNLLDLAEFASQWLMCWNPLDGNCLPDTLDYGLITHWNFDDGSAKDTSGNDNEGTVWGPTPISGLSGQGMNFDGNDYIIKTSALNLPQNNSSKTINIWFKWSNSVECYLAGMDDGTDNTGSAFAINYKNQWRVIGWYGQSVSDWHTSITDSYADNSWHMITVTYDGITTRFYIDGTERAQTSNNTYSSNLNTIWVGKSPSYGQSYYFIGILDELKIYNRTLTTNEILSLYSRTYGQLPKI